MRLAFLTGTVAVLLGCGGALRAAGDGDTTDAAGDPAHDVALDPSLEPEPDIVPDGTPDVEPDGADPECSDGIDNDGDDLIDMEDFDCANPDDDPEGPPEGECSIDNHCAAGWEECDRSTGTCYDPPQGELCAECRSSEDCGDGVTGDDPNRDFCLIGWWPPGSFAPSMVWSRLRPFVCWLWLWACRVCGPARPRPAGRRPSGSWPLY